MKNLFKKCPVLFGIVGIGLLLTILAALGRKELYTDLEYHPAKEPLLSLVLKGIREETYPWQMIQRNGSHGEETMAAALPTPSLTPEPAASANEQPAASYGKPTSLPTLTPTPAPTPKFPSGRLGPLRESTYEEYLNHISADIYGDIGALRAAEYPFVRVDESYFDDALFIGDSRTVGLRDYTDLSEHADFLCKTSLTIYKVMDEDFKGMGTVKEVLLKKDYGKIYLMIGINELGRGTTEDFMAKYTEVVDELHALEPDARIMIQANMKVTAKKSTSDDIFNNSNITARNHAIATLADNETFFYIDMNEAVCDENGDLKEEYTHDQIHLLGKYTELWKEYLLQHGIASEINTDE